MARYTAEITITHKLSTPIEANSLVDAQTFADQWQAQIAQVMGPEIIANSPITVVPVDQTEV